MVLDAPFATDIVYVPEGDPMAEPLKTVLEPSSEVECVEIPKVNTWQTRHRETQQFEECLKSGDALITCTESVDELYVERRAQYYDAPHVRFPPETA
jgi:hypothetical protein